MGSGRLRRIFAVAANTFRETVRERVLYNLVLFALLMILSGLVLKDLSIRQEARVIKDLGLASMELFGTLIALFMGVGLVAKEIERRSLYPLLSKPLSREEFLLGKFAGLGFTLLLNVGMMTAGLYLTVFTTGHPVEARLLQAVYGIFLGLLLVVSIALLFSSVTSSTVLALVCSVCLVVAGRNADVIYNAQEVAAGAPTWLLRSLYYALPNFRNFDFKARVVHGESVGAADLGWVSLYAAVYMVVVMAVAMGAFRRRDLQ